MPISKQKQQTLDRTRHDPTDRIGKIQSFDGVMTLKIGIDPQKPESADA